MHLRLFGDPACAMTGAMTGAITGGWRESLANRPNLVFAPCAGRAVAVRPLLLASRRQTIQS